MEENMYNMEENTNEDFYEDEIAKMYAQADIKEQYEKYLMKEANIFYEDFKKHDLNSTVDLILNFNETVINDSKTVNNINNIFMLLDNMIKLFEKTEEYEKCGFMLKIKNELKARV